MFANTKEPEIIKSPVTDSEAYELDTADPNDPYSPYAAPASKDNQTGWRSGNKPNVGGFIFVCLAAIGFLAKCRDGRGR